MNYQAACLGSHAWDPGGFNIAVYGLFQDTLMEENVQKMKEQLMVGHDISKEGRILMKEVVPCLHPMSYIHEEPFLLKDNGSQPC